MDLKKTFGATLVGEELYSNEDLGGGYPIDIGGIKLGIDKTSVNTPSEVPFFSDAVKEQLSEVYAQVFKLTLMWTLLPECDPLIEADTWLKSEYLNRGYDLPSMREELSGMIHILPFDEMLNDRAHVFWLNDNLETYYPFDVHYNLTACLKKINGRVENNIYIYHNRIPKVYNMKVTIQQYLQLAYDAKLFYNWQMAYINRSGMDWEKMKRMLPKIFPHVKLDLSAFGME